MIITSITRTISGSNYDNISATAVVGEEDDPVSVAKELDSKLRAILSAIDDHISDVMAAEKEKERTITLLEDALDYAKNREIPF